MTARACPEWRPFARGCEGSLISSVTLRAMSRLVPCSESSFVGVTEDCISVSCLWFKLGFPLNTLLPN